MTVLDNVFIEEYSGYMPSPKLYPAIRSIARMQSIYTWRMMYLLHRSVAKKDVHPQWISFPLDELARALKIDDEDPVGVILDTVQRISENPIQEAQRRQDGVAEAWLIEPWIYKAMIDEANQSLRLHLNQSASVFLLCLSALNAARPMSCIRLSRGHPIWMYITLTNASRAGIYWCISLSAYTQISHLTAFSSRDSRFVETEHKKNAQIMGLKASPDLREEEKLARKEKRPIVFKAMLLAKGGNLLTLRQKSELLVNVCQIKGFKSGYKGAVSHLAFSFDQADELVSYDSDRAVFKKDPTFAEEFIDIDLPAVTY